VSRSLVHRVALAVALVVASAAMAQDTIDIDDAKRRAAQLLEEGKRDEARPLLEQIAHLDPKDFVSLYNLACVRLSAGDRDAAEDALRRAIGVGFVDFHQMLRDPDLAALRDSATVRQVVGSWRRVLDLRADADAKAAIEALGPKYIHVVDPELRIHILSAFNEDATKAAHDELRTVARFVDEEIFEIEAPAERPDPWTLVILPTKEHFRRFVPFDGVGGVYDHDQRRLVTRDLGPSLRHEFVHVLHHRRMSRTGVRHAFWLQEGIASLVERVEPAPGRAVRSAPNWRINIARRLAEPRRLTPWETFFSLDSTKFVTIRPLAMYAQAYALSLWLYERGDLRAWMDAYERTADESPGGEHAFESVLSEDAATLQRDWRDWLVSKDFVPERFEDGASSLGVDLDDASDEGPRVVGVFARRSADSLRLRDVILAIDGAPVRTVAEAIQALDSRSPGGSVEVDVRRGRLDLTLTVPVVPFDERASRGLADRLR
jgi:tetratricopeptide (TPR) repeat protein